MCGRYTRFAATEEIYRHFGVRGLYSGLEESALAPSWNVTPQSMQPVIRLNPDTGTREMVLMRWGLVHSLPRAPPSAIPPLMPKPRPCSPNRHSESRFAGAAVSCQ